MRQRFVGWGLLEKADLRVWAKALPPPTAEEAEAVRRHLANWLCDRPAGTSVLTFLAMGGEIDLAPLTTALPSLSWATTRTPPVGELLIHPYDAPRERHPFGFEQPVADASTIDPADVALVLAPGLAFDRCGWRLGWGRGYYDRLLVRMPRATKVGVTLQRRLVDLLPHSDHDVKMQRLVTERGVWEVEECVP